MRRHAVALLAVGMAGCGGGDEPATGGAATATATPTPPAQQIERYTTEFDAEQTERLFGKSPSGVDPAALVGRWELQINSTLDLVEVRAPDGGGPLMDIVEASEDSLVLAEDECKGDFELAVSRSDTELALSHERGRCPETIDLLVEQPWKRE